MTSPSQAVVYDADAARAARAEAVGEGVPFLWTGQTFHMPPPKEWPIDVTACLSAGDLVGAMRLLLGDAYDEFAKGAPTLGDIEGIFKATAAAQGITLPE